VGELSIAAAESTIFLFPPAASLTMIASVEFRLIAFSPSGLKELSSGKISLYLRKQNVS
jgi:hypothetical protein